jgi:hypothetical protein
MLFNSSFYDHLRYFNAAVQRRGGTGEVRLGTMNALARIGSKEVEFLAQYLVRNPDGTRTYSMQYRDDALGFAGWLPHFNKRWPEAYDKLSFKRRCAALQLRTPAWSLDTVASDLGDFVIKSSRGSFGQAVRGPFKAAQCADFVLATGDYAERFAAGQIGKAWYWDDRVVSLELREPTSVVGDGHRNLAQLVRLVRRSSDVETVTDFQRYRALEWSQVPAEGERVVLDFKYGSPFARDERESSNRVVELANSDVLAQLNEWGAVFYDLIPLQLRPSVLYTVDFVLAESDQSIRLLEMNCNPTVPPEAYESIIASTFDGNAMDRAFVSPATSVSSWQPPTEVSPQTMPAPAAPTMTPPPTAPAMGHAAP